MPRDCATPDTDRLSVLSPADREWDTRKALADRLVWAYRSIAARLDDPADAAICSRYADRCYECADFLGFGHALCRDTGELRWKLRTASFCRVRYCSVCQWRRSMLWTSRFLAAWPELRAAYPTARFVLLTLTVRNCEPNQLRATLAHMNRSWQRLIERKDWPALGFVRATEITRARDGKAHPHFHALLMVRPSYFTHSYVKHSEWAERWRSCLRFDYTPVVDVRSVRDDPETIAGAVREVLKYSTKASDLDVAEHPDFLWHLTRQTRKLRFVASGGVLRDVLRENEEPGNEELTELEGKEDAEQPSSDAVVPFSFHRFKIDPHYRRIRKGGSNA